MPWLNNNPPRQLLSRKSSRRQPALLAHAAGCQGHPGGVPCHGPPLLLSPTQPPASPQDTIFPHKGVPGPPTQGTLAPAPLGARTLGNSRRVPTSPPALLWGPQLTQAWGLVALSAWLHGPHSTYVGVPSPRPHLAMGSPADSLRGSPRPPSPLRCRVPQCRWSPDHHPPCHRVPGPPLQGTPSHHPSAPPSPSSSLRGPWGTAWGTEHQGQAQTPDPALL